MTFSFIARAKQFFYGAFRRRHGTWKSFFIDYVGAARNEKASPHVRGTVWWLDNTVCPCQRWGERNDFCEISFCRVEAMKNRVDRITNCYTVGPRVWGAITDACRIHRRWVIIKKHLASLAVRCKAVALWKSFLASGGRRYHDRFSIWRNSSYDQLHPHENIKPLGTYCWRVQRQLKSFISIDYVAGWASSFFIINF